MISFLFFYIVILIIFIIKIDNLKLYCIVKYKKMELQYTTYKLGHICDIKKGDRIKLENTNYDDNNRYQIITNFENNKYYTNTYNRTENTILISILSSDVKKNLQKVFITQNVFSIHSKDQNTLNNEYLYHYLLNHKDDLENLKKGLNIKLINLQDLNEMEIHIPSIDEQYNLLNELN